MSQISCKIDALWDADAEVWVATSEDVPGLATEADTLEALTQKLRIIVPELLQLNQVIPDDQGSTIAIDLTSHRQEIKNYNRQRTVNNLRASAAKNRVLP